MLEHQTMEFKAYLKILILIICTWTFNAQDNCPYKECQCASPEIYCTNLGLKKFPTLINPGVSGFTDLMLDVNEIILIPPNCLPLNLTEILLTHNPVTVIDDEAFTGSTDTLDTISFDGALFTRIPDAFKSLRSLKYFSIYNTLIQDWNDGAMKVIGQTIVRLDLENVSLSSWPTWMQYFTQLSELNLDDTSISSIPDNAFDLLVNSLTGLSISSGSLTSIPKSLSKLLVLESLDLTYNKIVDVSYIPRISNISSISLQYNHISDPNLLSSSLKYFGHSLRSLEINNNQLTAIPDFSALINIGSLSFSHNRISDPTSGTLALNFYELDLGNNFLPAIPSLFTKLKSLSSVTLPFNSITKIQATDFHSSIYDVRLEHNLITELTDNSFPFNSSIMTLNLNYNPLTTISAGAFSNLPNLNTLHLRGTKLSRFPLQLATLVSLQSLDISDSTKLVCTCNEKDLEKWVHGLEEIQGDCGITSVYDFFVHLSSSCPDSM